MSTEPQVREEPKGDADLIDRIAELLPDSQRPLWYREMAHLRRLPADDEMLRIAHAMGFLALVTRETPHQIAHEREELATILTESVTAIQETQRSVVKLHDQLESRLKELPTEISAGIRPGVIAAKLNESLRQEFLKSGIPETAQTLTVISRQTRQAATEFERATRELALSQQSFVKDAREALDQMQSGILRAADTAKDCARNLTRTFLREYKWSVLVLCLSALLIGVSLGILYQRWRSPAAPVAAASTRAVPAQRLPEQPQHSTVNKRAIPSHKTKAKRIPNTSTSPKAIP